VGPGRLRKIRTHPPSGSRRGPPAPRERGPLSLPLPPPTPSPTTPTTPQPPGRPLLPHPSRPVATLPPPPTNSGPPDLFCRLYLICSLLVWCVPVPSGAPLVFPQKTTSTLKKTALYGAHVCTAPRRQHACARCWPALAPLPSVGRRSHRADLHHPIDLCQGALPEFRVQSYYEQNNSKPTKLALS
jgi:hypothetical protein